MLYVFIVSLLTESYETSKKLSKLSRFISCPDRNKVLINYQAAKFCDLLKFVILML